MPWWVILVLVYAAICYASAIFISLLHQLNEGWPIWAVLLFTIMAPMVVPLWATEFIRCNR